jgi:hypothetical protein
MSDTLTATQVGKKIRLVWTYTPAPSWPDVQGYIYNEGEHEEMWEVGLHQSGATPTKRPTTLRITAEDDAEASFVTTQRIDLTPYSSLKINMYFVTDVGEGHIIVSSNQTGSLEDYTANVTLWGSPGTNTLNVSNLSGEYYIRIHVRNYDPYGWGMSSFLDVYKVWLE